MERTHETHSRKSFLNGYEPAPPVCCRFGQIENVVIDTPRVIVRQRHVGIRTALAAVGRLAQ